MSWIKRNLYFLIGSVVALVLMGLAGFYLFSNYKRNTEMLTKLNEQYTVLNDLNNQNPHPGNPPKGPDNIQAAKDQQLQLREFVKKTAKFFHRIPPIPTTESGRISSQEFSTALRRMINQLQHEATNSSVVLPASPQGYNFSFEAVINRFTFATGSVDRLAVQLGEVKTICDVLFLAKINSLDNIRRERVSTDDNSGPASDYLVEKSATNELAILTPYEITFRCFTPELGSVLAGFASSPYGLLVRTINVELAAVATPSDITSVGTAPVVPVAIPIPQTQPKNPMSEQDAFRRRYGISPGGPTSFERPATPTPTYVIPAPTAASKGGLPTVIDEKQLKVTLMLHVVKLIPVPEK